VSIRLIIFDFDGTLINSEPGILESIKLTVDALELPQSAVEQWRQMIGIPLSVQLAKLLPPNRQQEVEHGVETYRNFYRQVGIAHSDPFEGIPELINFLTPRVSLAIASSKGYEGLSRVLTGLDWLDYFDPIISPISVTHPKPHPESIELALQHYDITPEQAVMIGDTEYDMEMAVRAGVPAWAVGWGVHEKKQLLNAGANQWFARPGDLLTHVKEVF
jgi:HAD superfamily hydrolase (TIGR01549 family)